jgi:hypothetical protein
MDTKGFRSIGSNHSHSRASRFMDRFTACKGELVERPLPTPASGTDACARREPREGSFVQLYLKARAAARQ